MFVTATIYVLLFILGITLGDLLRIEGADAPQLYARTNAYIFLGLAIFVALRMLLPHLKRKPQLPVFDLRNWSSVIAMSVASGINVLLIGLGLGFVMPIAGHVHWAIWPLFISSVLLGYTGIMFGRQKVTIRPLRWMIVACILSPRWSIPDQENLLSIYCVDTHKTLRTVEFEAETMIIVA